MMKKTLHIILFLAILYGSAEAQQDIPGYIRLRFSKYCKEVPRQEVFIQTDREEYAAGEDMWLNAWLFDRQGGKLSVSDRIAYFEIINPESKAVVRKKVLLDNGMGSDHVVIPDTLRSGIYTIVAYTSWMKNFLPYNCFMKEIKVYNPSGKDNFLKSRKPPGLKEAGISRFEQNPSIGLKCENPGNDSVRLTIMTGEAYRLENNNTFYLFVQARGNISHLSTQQVSSGKTIISLPGTDFSAGVNQVTIFDRKGPACERYIYIPPANTGHILLSSPDSCRKRGKMVLDIQTPGGTLDTSRHNMCISVGLSDGSSGFPGIGDYMVFGTEFGLYPWMKIGGRSLAELPPAVMDSLMQTISSNWIVWERVFSTDEAYYRYPHETGSDLILGRLLGENGEQPGAGNTVIMSCSGGEPYFRYTETDEYGNFSFDTDPGDIPGDMIIQTDPGTSGFRPVVESSFQNMSLSEPLRDTAAGINPGAKTIARNLMVRKLYGSVSAKEVSLPGKSPSVKKRFYGKPDFTLTMSDYIKLDSMAEVFFELVPRVRLLYGDRDCRISVIGEGGEIMEENPYVMVDGVLVKDPALIARIDPEAVRKIDVVWDKYRIGGYIFNGIINIFLKNGFTGELLPGDAVSLHYTVPETAVTFTSPDYSTVEKRAGHEADFRNTLYWNPSVKTNEKGRSMVEFWAPDNTGEYTIAIEGFSPSGSLYSVRKKIWIY